MTAEAAEARTGERSPLRVGVLLDDLWQPAWIRRILTDLRQSPIAEIVLVVANLAAPAPRPAWRKLFERPHHALYGLYSAVDRYLFAPRPGGRPARVTAGAEGPALDASAPASVAGLVEAADSLSIRPVQDRFSDYFTDADVETILGYELDVALRFGFRIIRGRALEIARYGVWSYHHADNRVNRGGPAGFWEVFERAPTTGSLLQVLNEDLDNGTVIYRSATSTDPYSVTRNRNTCFWISASFVQRCLRDVYERQPAAPLASVDREPFVPYSNRLYTIPRNGEMARLAARHVAHVMRLRVKRKLMPEQWGLAYSRRSEIPSMHRLRLLPGGAQRLWADPFPVFHEEGHFVFFEQQLPGEPAHVAVMKLAEDGSWSQPSTVLRSDGHISYPFVFEWDGSLFMVPETADKRRVELYRCAEFPTSWELEDVLLEDVWAVDATLAKVEERWWLFVSIAPDEAAIFDELFLYYADSPLGPWTPHRRNPVKSDARNSRPGGRLFWQDGKLYRPAQDCGPRYGYATVINEVERLDEDCYEEREVAALRPDWDRRVVAGHNYNSVAGLTVCDVRLRYPVRAGRQSPHA